MFLAVAEVLEEKLDVDPDQKVTYKTALKLEPVLAWFQAYLQRKGKG